MLTKSLVARLRLRALDAPFTHYDPGAYTDAADRLEALERLIEEMASLIRVADFEDLGDYHASLEILKQCENL